MHLTRTSLRPGTHVVQISDEFRVLTVISGVLYTGFGDSVHERQAARLEPGCTWSVPERKRHFLWAKDGEVVFQQLGMGKTARGSQRRLQGS
jgi:hypothetical protein